MKSDGVPVVGVHVLALPEMLLGEIPEEVARFSPASMPVVKRYGGPVESVVKRFMGRGDRTRIGYPSERKELSMIEGVQTMFYTADEGGEDGQRAGTHDISLYCDDIEKTVGGLAARRVELDDRAENRGYGLVTHFRRPGGLRFQLRQPRVAKGGG